MPGFLLCVFVHGALVDGRVPAGLPFNPFWLHFLALGVLIPTIVLQRLAYKDSPEHRAAPMRALWISRPRWMFAAGLAIFVYVILNFVYLAGDDALRRMSGHWLFFMWAGILMNYPWARFPEVSRVREVVPHAFQVEPVSMTRRVMRGADGFIIAWTGILSLAAFIAAGYFNILYLLFPGFLFLIATIVNGIFRMRRVKYHITSANIAGGVCRLEFLEHDTPRRLELPLHELKLDMEEKQVKGTSLFRLCFFQGDAEILHQANTKWWPYPRLQALRERIEQEKTA